MTITEKVWTESQDLINNKVWRKLYKDTGGQNRNKTFYFVSTHVSFIVKPILFSAWHSMEDTTRELNKEEKPPPW